MHPSLGGLYAVTDGREGEALYQAVGAVLRGGARYLQYRDKTSNQAHRLRAAQRLQQLCAHFQTGFIINDDIELALQLGAGVHLGRDDGDLHTARQRLGPQAIIGLSCYNQMPDARSAAAASYLAFGAVFPSATKPDAVQAPLALLGEARQAFPGKALCAIGGIHAGNAAQVVTAGADLIAVVAGLFAATDTDAMLQRARQLAAVFPQHTTV